MVIKLQVKKKKQSQHIRLLSVTRIVFNIAYDMFANLTNMNINTNKLHWQQLLRALCLQCRVQICAHIQWSAWVCEYCQRHDGFVGTFNATNVSYALFKQICLALTLVDRWIRSKSHANFGSHSWRQRFFFFSFHFFAI